MEEIFALSGLVPEPTGQVSKTREPAPPSHLEPRPGLHPPVLPPASQPARPPAAGRWRSPCRAQPRAIGAAATLLASRGVALLNDLLPALAGLYDGPPAQAVLLH